MMTRSIMAVAICLPTVSAHQVRCCGEPWPSFPWKQRVGFAADAAIVAFQAPIKIGQILLLSAFSTKVYKYAPCLYIVWKPQPCRARN
jgi:hypothetical protein